jgi:hypothetical protein
MNGWRLLSWDPKGLKESSEAVARAEDVANRAARLLEQYRNASDEHPGLTLEGSDSAVGSMAIAVAPFGWALIHSSEDHLTQHCTKVSGPDGGPSIPVMWDQETLIPRNWFIAEPLALKGVRHFLDYGTLAPDLPWSDHCDE